MISIALDDRILISSDIDIAFQELDILFGTYQTELLGDIHFGANFEYYLNDLANKSSDIQSYIYSLINSTPTASKLKHDVSVNFMEGEYRTVYYVTISFYTSDNEAISKSYQLQ